MAAGDDLLDPNATQDATAAAKAREGAAAAARDAELAKQRELAAARDAAARQAVERQKALEDARARVRNAAAALERERALADALEKENAVTPDGDGKTDHHAGFDAFDDNDAAFEAATIANLHAQASSVQNIRALVPLVLELSSTHYSKWRGHVLLVLGRYSLSDHVLADGAFPDVPAWYRMDCVVLSWLFNTISNELMEIVSDRGRATARSAWLGIESQFLGNRETRALHLDAEFHNFVQGDLSVSDYCRKMKGMADALGDLGEPVHDRTLVLNILRGLNEKFQYMAALITRQRPFPCFRDVRTDLELEEIRMPQRLASSTSTALYAAPPPASKDTRGTPPAPPPGRAPGAPSGASSGAPHGAPHQVQQQSGTGNRNNRRRRKNNQGQSGWPSFFNPWTGTIQMWPGPSSSGTQPRAAGPSPRPPQHAFFAGAPGPYGFPMPVPVPMVHPGFAPPLAPVQQPQVPPQQQQQPAVGALAWSPWDPHALANAFSTVTLTPPASSNEWVVDSGASSHMTSNAGPSFQERDRQVQ